MATEPAGEESGTGQIGAATHAAHPPRVRPPLLWALVATAVVFGYLLYTNWASAGQPYVAEARHWLASLGEARQFARSLANDPAVGASLPQVLAPRDGEPAHGTSGATVILVFAGPLKSCCTGRAQDLAQRLDAVANAAQSARHATVALIVEAPPAEAQRYAEESHMYLPVIPDEGGFLTRAYNAFWSPRVYALEGERLKWVQKRQAFDEGELVDAMSTRPTTNDRMSIGQHGVKS